MSTAGELCCSTSSWEPHLRQSTSALETQDGLEKRVGSIELEQVINQHSPSNLAKARDARSDLRNTLELLRGRQKVVSTLKQACARHYSTRDRNKRTRATFTCCISGCHSTRFTTNEHKNSASPLGKDQLLLHSFQPSRVRVQPGTNHCTAR